MELSDADFEAKLEKVLPKKLKEMGLLYTATELATKSEIKELITAMDRRFEAMDRRFEAMDRHFEAMIQEIKAISAGLGTLGNRTGNEFEQLVRSLFKETLALEGINVDKIEKLGIRNSDPKILNGLRKIIYDGYFHDGQEILLEVKFSMDQNKVAWFYQKCKAFEQIKGRLPKMWVVVVNIDPFARDLAEEYGMKVITRLEP